MDYKFIDLHTDTLFRMMDEKRQGTFNEKTDMHIDFKKIEKGSPLAVTLAMFTEDKKKQELRTVSLNNMLSIFFSIIDSNTKLVQTKTVNDIFLANEQNKYSVILGIEGCGGLLSADDLNWLYQLGLRILSPVWNDGNLFAFGNDFPEKGLTREGVRLIKGCKELGIAVDISHLNYKGFFEVVDLMQDVPFIATHSNAYRLCPTPRNLKDDQIKAIKEANGVIGITFYNEILKRGSSAGIEDVIKHIDYIVDKVGIDHVAIGSDFDGIEKSIDGIDNIGMMQNLFCSLEKKGYTKKNIKKIACENALRVFSEIWK